MNTPLVVIETKEESSLAEPMSLGERKALRRAQHLCLRCSHWPVCKVVAAADPEMLVIVSHCMKFQPMDEPANVPASGKA
jgi:hypothetical protein